MLSPRAFKRLALASTFAVAAVLALALAGCADIYTTGRQVLTGGEYAVQTVASGTAAYDAIRDPELTAEAVAACSTDAACKKAFPALVKYRANVDALRKALRAAHAALGAAAAGLTVAELVKANATTVSAVLEALKGPLKDVVRLAAELGIASPGLAALVGGL